ncbi:MAG: polysulfide reductase NrfD, partial [bacterium]|nr:polysulfide reductase NrfD [bacterium]
MFRRFALDSTREAFRGGRRYRTWLGVLGLFIAVGLLAYLRQARSGLVVTGMSDQVSWGLYIANFTFFVGVAAAAVMVVVPAYIFKHEGAHSVVLIAEGVAVAACFMSMLVVMVHLGRPARFSHLLPFPGRSNWPVSLPAVDE